MRACDARLPRHRCDVAQQHIHERAWIGRRRRQDDPRVQRCTTARAARVSVTVRVRARAASAVAARPPRSACADGERRRRARIRRRMPGGVRGGGWRVRQRAGRYVHLPLRRLILRELPMTSRPFLWRLPVRAQAVRWSAARRSAALPEAVLDGHGAAHEQLFDRSGVAIPRGIVQRRPPPPEIPPARQTAGFGRPSADVERKGSPAVVLGVDVGVGVDQSSDDSAIAVVRRPVQRGVPIPVRRGWVKG